MVGRGVRWPARRTPTSSAATRRCWPTTAGLAITSEQRFRFASLMSLAADDAGLPGRSRVPGRAGRLPGVGHPDRACTTPSRMPRWWSMPRRRGGAGASLRRTSPNPLASGAVGCEGRRMPDIHFDEEIAASYDDDSDERFDPGVLARTTEFLADLAGDGRALELRRSGRVGSPYPWPSAGSRCRASSSRRYMLERLRAKPGAAGIEVTEGDMATARGGRRVLARVPRLQHDHEPDLTGRAGRVLPERARATWRRADAS